MCKPKCLVLVKFGFKLFGSFYLYSSPWLCSRFKFVNSFSWVLIGEWDMVIFLGYAKIFFSLPLGFSLFCSCIWICHLIWEFSYVICKLELKLSYQPFCLSKFERFLKIPPFPFRSSIIFYSFLSKLYTMTTKNWVIFLNVVFLNLSWYQYVILDLNHKVGRKLLVFPQILKTSKF